jgi:hypothetical protein
MLYLDGYSTLSHKEKEALNFFTPREKEILDPTVRDMLTVCAK